GEPQGAFSNSREVVQGHAQLACARIEFEAAAVEQWASVQLEVSYNDVDAGSEGAHLPVNLVAALVCHATCLEPLLGEVVHELKVATQRFQVLAQVLQQAQ